MCMEEECIDTLARVVAVEDGVVTHEGSQLPPCPDRESRDAYQTVRTGRSA
jgi:hypothetical protein